MSQPGLWIAGVEKPGSHQWKARDFSPEFSALACSLLSQVFFSGPCGWCSTVGQHRLMLFLCCREGGRLLPVAAEKTRKFLDRLDVLPHVLLGFGVLASGPQRAAQFSHLWNLTRRPGAAEESYSAHKLIRRDYSLFLLCKKERKDLF